MQLVEPFIETKTPYFLDNHTAVRAGMMADEQLTDEQFKVGALFLGLDFVGSVQ